MNGFRSADSDSASLVLAIAMWLAVLAPQWVLLLFGLKHLARLREAVARSFGLKLLAAICWMGAVLLAASRTVWVCRDLLGPERLGVQRFVANGTLIHEGLLIVVGIFLLSRRKMDGAYSQRRNRT
jgi:hypothetical protein